MAVTRKSHVGTAIASAIIADMNATATSFTVKPGDGTGYPSGATAPFVVTLDKGSAGKEEKILIATRTGDVFNVATGGRGFDGTTAQIHNLGAPVEHTISAAEFDELNRHAADPAQDDHTQYMLASGTRHDLPARHAIGTSLPTPAAPVNVDGNVAAAGISTAAARDDHKHTFTSGTPLTIVPTVTPLAGSGNIARSDHVHGILTAAPTASSPGDVGAEGTATSFARSDHKHAREAALNVDYTETWAGTSLPTTGNFEGRKVYATSLTSTYFQNKVYEYRGGKWRLTTPIHFVAPETRAGNLTLAPGTWEFGGIALDPGIVPCDVMYGYTACAVMLTGSTTTGTHSLFSRENAVDAQAVYSVGLISAYLTLNLERPPMYSVLSGATFPPLRLRIVVGAGTGNATILNTAATYPFLKLMIF